MRIRRRTHADFLMALKKIVWILCKVLKNLCLDFIRFHRITLHNH